MPNGVVAVHARSLGVDDSKIATEKWGQECQKVSCVASQLFDRLPLLYDPLPLFSYQLFFSFYWSLLFARRPEIKHEAWG